MEVDWQEIFDDLHFMGQICQPKLINGPWTGEITKDPAGKFWVQKDQKWEKGFELFRRKCKKSCYSHIVRKQLWDAFSFLVSIKSLLSPSEDFQLIRSKLHWSRSVSSIHIKWIGEKAPSQWLCDESEKWCLCSTCFQFIRGNATRM